MHMPGWTGPETAAVIASEFPQIKVLFLSGSMDAVEIAGAEVPVLMKPIRPGELLAAVEKAL
jgi:CheY-like chemotaxis protein